MFRTLRSKLIFSYAAVAVLSLALALTVTFALARDYARSNGFKTLYEKKALTSPYVQLLIKEQFNTGLKGLPRELAGNLKASIRSSNIRLLIVNPTTMVAEFDSNKRFNTQGQRFPLNASAPDFQQKLDNGLEGTIQLAGETVTFQYVAQRLPITVKATPQSVEDSPATRTEVVPYILVVAQPQPGLREIVDQARGYILPAVAVALLAALIVGYLLARSISQPISRLAVAAGAIARGEYKQRVPVSGHGELALLTQEFNDMASEVSRAHQVQRDFIANVSHDLKTPLTSIQGFSQAILEGAVKDETGYKQAAQIINTEAQRMGRLVSQLLTLSRLQSNLTTMEMRPIELNPLLAQLVLAMQPLSAEANVELMLKIGTSSGIVLADADRLREAFSNLIENAIKYTQSGGTVTVETKQAPSGVEIEVRDTGRGIPKEDLPRVTERFYQVDKSRSSGVGQSVGLGLAITREVILAHQGKMDIESTPGVGTTVRVTLPATGEQRNGKPHLQSLMRRHTVTADGVAATDLHTKQLPPLEHIGNTDGNGSDTPAPRTEETAGTR